MSPSTQIETVLAGDIGATRSRLAVVRIGMDGAEIARREEYRSADFPDLGEVVDRYLQGIDPRPERAGFGVAAPVRGGIARFANLDWEVERDELSRRIGVDDVHLVNDFEALCHGLPLLGPDGLDDVLEGRPDPDGTMAVLGAGTGLGHAFVTREGGARRVHSSEAGHADFAPRDEDQDALLRWLRERHGRASYERVLSGPGLVDVYRFLVETERAPEDPATRARLEAEEAAAVVSELGTAGTDPACRGALEIFVDVYGAQAGNFALAVQATGGVYLGGGIAPAILPALRGERFRRAFREKGKLARMVAEIPVRVISDPDAGLLGAAEAVRRSGR